MKQRERIAEREIDEQTWRQKQLEREREIEISRKQIIGINILQNIKI